MQLICAHCGARTNAEAPCSDCAKEPLLRGRYALMAVLGEGASGTTYRARDMSSPDGSGFDVAIKELAFHRVDTFKAQDLFEREAAVLCRLDHPGVPQFFDSFAAGEGKSLRFYLVMEFIAGHTLEDELDSRQFSQDDVLAILEELGGVTGYLHALSPPVIHRDIKPSNVMRRSDGSLVLVDFGSVRDALEPDDAGSTIAGTIGYMAPEQLRGAASPASDVYGLATCALHLLTRKPPVELLDGRNNLRWEGLVELSAGFEHLLRQMLASNPGVRPQNGREVAKAAHRVRQAPDDAPAPAPQQSSASPQTSRVRAMLVFAISLLVVLLSAAMFLIVSDSDAPNSQPQVVTAPQPQPVAEPEPVKSPIHDDKTTVQDKPVERLSRNQVRETMQGSLDRIGDECGPRRGDDEPKLVTVRLKVTPSGDVAWAEQKGEEHPSAYAKCVLDVVESLSFPTSKKPLTVNFPLIYGR